jgi:predicted type IV restriction endonuclease
VPIVCERSSNAETVVKEQLEQYVKKVKERQEFCQGNEATTKASLIAPLFAMLGWDMTDPRECQPEFRADFGKGEKAATPVDWAFATPPTFAFIVEAKECGKKLRVYAEQLGMYFAKASVNLGIYTNGVQWQFYADLDKMNIMDKEPFLTWDILADDPIPLDFLTLLQKSQFKPQLLKTFAERGRRQSLLVTELVKLLDPSGERWSDFTRLAVEKIETRKLVASVVEEWKPILFNAIEEWAKIKALEVALERPAEKRNQHALEPTKTRMFKGKTCPSCGATGLGFRKTACDCGYVFRQDEPVVQPAQQPEVTPQEQVGEAKPETTIPFPARDAM